MIVVEVHASLTANDVDGLILMLQKAKRLGDDVTVRVNTYEPPSSNRYIISASWYENR